MRRLVLILFLLSLNVVDTKRAESKEYVHCNVFLDTVCFGIRDGDTYSVQVKVDFKLSNITLKNGDTLEIYEGRHPEPFDFSAAYLSKISSEGYLVSAIKTDSLQQRIFVEPIEKRIPTTDIFVKLHDNDVTTIRDFLENFKSCSRTKLEVKCSERSLFTKLEF